MASGEERAAAVFSKVEQTSGAKSLPDLVLWLHLADRSVRLGNVPRPDLERGTRLDGLTPLEDAKISKKIFFFYFLVFTTLPAFDLTQWF